MPASEGIQVSREKRDDAREREARLVEAFRMLPGCAWMADDRLRYESFLSSPEKVFGQPEAELIGRPLWSWAGHSDAALIPRVELERAVTRHRVHLDLAWQLPAPDGEPRWLGESLYLRYDDGGRLECIVGLTNDITERKRREANLAALQQQARKMEAIGTLVGGIAHEFNNMLAGIVGNVFLLKAELKDNPKQKERLERIEKLSSRAAHLIEQMLAFGRKRPARLKTLQLDSLVREVARVLEPDLGKNIALKLKMNANATVRADATQLKQALGSLLQNAMDAVAERDDARIEIRLDIVDGDDNLVSRLPRLAGAPRLARVIVRDNGPGIPPRILRRVFDPFFTTKEVGGGTGMGLPLAWGVMDAMGGAVELDSEEGVGTEARLYLPLAEDGKDDEWVSEDSGEVFPGQGETLLLADDEELVREAACGVLRRLGYQVMTAADGAEALEIVQQQGDALDLVILDLIMPNMGGMEAAKHIRELQPDMPLLFITGFDLNDTLDRRLHMDNADVVTKPFNVSELSRAVRRLLATD